MFHHAPGVKHVTGLRVIAGRAALQIDPRVALDLRSPVKPCAAASPVRLRLCAMSISDAASCSAIAMDWRVHKQTRNDLRTTALDQIASDRWRYTRNARSN